MPPRDSWRLPRAVEPQHYELVLTPDLDNATFEGDGSVLVRVHEATTTVVLNAADLDISFAELEREDGSRLAGSVSLEADERAAVHLDGTVDPGTATLRMRWSGQLNDQLKGFYRSTYQDEAGRSHTIAATQFEPTDARRAFPCWDEPDFKATFGITLVVDEDLTAISNCEVVAREGAGEGRARVRFADTIPMSTYLVAFVVGPLALTEAVDVEGVELRVACVPGKEGLAGFGLEVAAHSLRFFSRYFGIPYPAAKLDLVALPDFAMGAMENLGAVTFRETALLVDPDRATRLELERVADVVAHEIAHMWFGDLVTMRWWNGIWLNEAFATFMELLCVDDFRPEWERWVSFGLSRGHAMVVDALASTRPVEFPVGRPEEAEAMFDTLTYQKGAAVLRMLERYVGAEAFRRGIAGYIATHLYDNTETSDLWDAVEAATGEPARSIMESWIFQGGYPAVTVEVDPAGTEVVLTQSRFRYLEPPDREPEPLWQVPVHLRAAVDGEVVRRRLLLQGDRATVQLDGKAQWVVANDGGWGFYRARYQPELLTSLTTALDSLDPLERYNLVNDTWASVLVGTTPVADFVSLARLFGDETDPNVWAVLLGSLGYLDRMLEPDDRPLLQALVQGLAGPALERVGWKPRADEPDTVPVLRSTLIQALGGLGADPGVRETARHLHGLYLEDPRQVDADVAGAVVGVVAAAGDADDYEVFVDRYRSAATPQEEIRYLMSLAAFEDVELATRTMELARTEVRTQNAPFLVSRLLANRVAGERAWELLVRHWDELLARFPSTLHDRMLEGVTQLSRPAVAAEVHAFLEAHPLPGKERAVAQLLERLDVSVAFRQREAAGLADLLRPS